MMFRLPASWCLAYVRVYPRLVDELPPSALGPLKTAFSLAGALTVEDFFLRLNEKAFFTGLSAAPNALELISLLLDLFPNIPAVSQLGGEFLKHLPVPLPYFSADELEKLKKIQLKLQPSPAPSSPILTRRVSNVAAVLDLMAQIPRHPNVLPLPSQITAPTCSIDTLHYMQIRDCTPMRATELRSLFSQLVAAVEHLHRNSIVHRDIKCENIVLTGSEHRLVLADFSFATLFRHGSETLTEALGSLHYSSPEICDQIPYEGPEVDVWSMGVVLYAWATGRLPFGGSSHEISARVITGTYTIPAHVNKDLAALIKGMLEVKREKRLTIAGIRAHPWFAATATTTVPDTAAPRLTVVQSTAVVRNPTPPLCADSYWSEVNLLCRHYPDQVSALEMAGKLPGMVKVKATLLALCERIQHDKTAKEMSVCYNALFEGNPGTGMTHHTQLQQTAVSGT